MRRCVSATIGVVVTVIATTAAAQENCPEGDWFCEESTDEPVVVEVDPEAGDQVRVYDVEEDETKDKNDGVVVKRKDKPRTKVIVVERGPKKKAAEPPPKPKRKRRGDWGFNLRLEGALIDDGESQYDPGMGGLGFSFRYRVVPHFAFDAGLDFLGGTDYNGRSRSETALLLSGIVFFNPKDVVQVYAPVGIGFSGATVEIEPRDGEDFQPFEERYSYFGAHLGAGLEFRVGKKTALNFDLLGFIRGRTDEKARRNPEFVDPDTGVATNTSGGGLVRGGITFYW